MTQVDTSIFRKYDVRGTVGGDKPQITPDLARLVGKALGTYLPKEFQTERVFVGCDNRATSPGLKAVLIEGIASAGLNVTDIGAVLTPTVYFASASYGKKGAGVMITGSHLAPDQNGFKLCVGARSLYGDAIQALRLLVEQDDFNGGYEAAHAKDNPLLDYIVDVVPRLRMARSCLASRAADCPSRVPGRATAGDWLPGV